MDKVGEDKNPKEGELKF